MSIGAMRVGSPAGALAPLTAARTIHVDSALGADIGDGSSVLPFATLARAWTERLAYGELRAALTVQLHGVGPYTMPVMGASVCGVGGYFIIRGDESADVIAVTSTFTGDFNTTTFVAPATAGLGSDTHKGKFLWITSGNCAGTRSLILSNTNTSITLPLAEWRTTNGAVANGDTFQIRAPGTVINVPAAASGQPVPGSSDWTGGFNPVAGFFTGQGPRHLVVGVSFTGSALQWRNSAVMFLGCVTAVAFSFFRCFTTIGALADGALLGVGADSATHLLSGYGLSCTGQFTVSSGSNVFVCGLYVTGLVFIGSSSLSDELLWNGGRVDGLAFINGGRWEVYSTSMTQVSKTINVSNLGQFVLTAGTWVFAVTSGDCIQLQDRGYGRINVSPTLSGGTTDAAGFGVRALSGSCMIFQNKTPVLTGGTLNNDIKAESTAAIANATLGSNGTSTLDAVTQAIVMRVSA